MNTDPDFSKPNVNMIGVDNLNREPPRQKSLSQILVFLLSYLAVGAVIYGAWRLLSAMLR